ncbi:TetR/AcrR family transcriptional regulator [Methylocella sp.]|uniref:TetR/AcrR family transcriptional regulator n=1 Tax=Methylocella sp. TaxID=1978226 RepID=UPI00378427B7
MAEERLSKDQIVDAAEAALRRFGLAKTSVVDVARSLGVTHGALYRHFDGKADIVDAVSARWLERINGPLAVIAAETGPAAERLRRWFDVLIASQTAQAQNDPELFLAFAEMARRDSRCVAAELERRATHVAKIIDDGRAQGAFNAPNPVEAAHALLDAATKFLAPDHVADWRKPEAAARFDAAFRLLLQGLATR